MSISVFWFRRDLRLEDNVGLEAALKSGKQVLPVFIFDTEILDTLTSRKDARVEFIHQTLSAMDAQLRILGSGLWVYHGKPAEAFEKLITQFDVSAVFTNRDYEPQAIKRDDRIHSLLSQHNIPFHTFKDQVIFEKSEILSLQNQPYTVFTPYSKKWKAALTDHPVRSIDLVPLKKKYFSFTPEPFPSLSAIGFAPSGCSFPSATPSDSILRNYDKTRDLPAVDGTSKLSLHLRFGTVSVRQAVIRALSLNETFLNELTWREFFMQILFHFPRVVNESFKPQYEKVQWRDSESDFEKWKTGMTGFPIVDAGMRELSATGHMHNRVRMITANFLVKHLLIDWKWGEQWFADQLLDFELSSNNGNWQWSAGCGCDAAPYFRIFNPVTQQEKFDPDFVYVKKWVHEFGTADYPAPMLDMKESRLRCMQAYGTALKSN